LSAWVRDRLRHLAPARAECPSGGATLVVSQGSRSAQEELIGAVISLLDCHAETGLADLLKLMLYRILVDRRLSKRIRGGAGRGASALQLPRWTEGWHSRVRTGLPWASRSHPCATEPGSESALGCARCTRCAFPAFEPGNRRSSSASQNLGITINRRRPK
jgi:hypothetical protein